MIHVLFSDVNNVFHILQPQGLGIDFACYTSGSVSQGGSSSMTDSSVIEHLMAMLSYGDKNDNPYVLCYKDQFLGGLNPFQGLCTDDADSRVSKCANLLTVLPSLHQQSYISIFMVRRLNWEGSSRKEEPSPCFDYSSEWEDLKWVVKKCFATARKWWHTCDDGAEFAIRWILPFWLQWGWLCKVVSWSIP